MKFLLTSAGLRNEKIVDALQKLVGKPLSETTVIFIPSAANTEGGDKGWLVSNLVDFQRQNFKAVDISDIAGTPEENWKKRFEEADVICFGGGNEKYLAELLKKMGMKEYFSTMSKDKVYMGISAGSMVAGMFMPEKLYPEIFPEEDFGATTTAPMELYSFCFIPHLNSSFFSQVRKEKLEALKHEFTAPVYSTDDETAIAIDGENIEIVGGGDYWISK
ncbi:MAG: Type 1 glutamine amidotransferase-like domain-containing protein [Minisyncoccia bacterium]